MHNRPRPETVAALLFSSGLCALIYQSVWLREFRLIFGASTPASAAVLGIFMGGLGLGSAYLGRRAEASRRPLLLYGNLELLIALFAAVTPLLLIGVRHLYMATGGDMVLGHFFGTVVRLIMASIVLIGPTFLMGGTLPAAARSITSTGDSSRRHLALLYGFNTLGAVTGAAISTFWLVEVVGNRTTLWLACGVNAIIAMLARSIGQRSAEIGAEAESEPEDEVTAQAEPQANPQIVVAASGVVGFAFMLMELVWYRMLSPILGGSTFTFGLILVVALLGIGLGGVTYTWRGVRRVPTLNGFAATCALEALFMGIPYALGDRLAYLALVLRSLGAMGFPAQVLGWAIVAGIVILPAAIVAGFQFPMLIGLLGRGREGVARQTGTAYAANTLGAIIGSLVGGFGVLPLLGALGVWKLVVGLLATLAIFSALRSRTEGTVMRIGPMLTAALAIGLLTAAGPSAVWRHGGIGAGRADQNGTNLNQLASFYHSINRGIVWETDGLESSVALDGSNGLSFIVNGKADGSARTDAGTQVMSGMLSALLHPAPKTAMVIGLGTGCTAGWMGSIPDMDRVDVVELEPAILEVARRCAAVNENMMNNPKVHCHLGDAREVLITTPRKYDIIFSEPSNPYRAGIASLFTLDFYQSAQQRLNPGGLFVQWVQAYEVDAGTLRTVISTVAKAFPNVQTWSTQAGDLVLVSSFEPIKLDVKELRERMSKPGLREALLKTWRVNSVEGVFAHFIGNEELARRVTASHGDVATDDRNPLEYGFARGIGKRTQIPLAQQVAGFSESNQLNRPLHLQGEVDWERVRHPGISDYLPVRPATPSLDEPKETKAWRIFFQMYRNRQHEEAMKLAKAEKLEPSSPLEIEAFAACATFARAADAEQWIDQLEKLFPEEAIAMRACAAAGRGDWPAAVHGFTETFKRWQTEPWIKAELQSDCMNSANFVAAACNDPTLAKALYASLASPFAVAILDEERLSVRLKIARLCEPGRRNAILRDALKPYDQHPLWDRNFLLERAGTLQALGDPLVSSAEADYVEYNENSIAPFEDGLPAGSVADSGAKTANESPAPHAITASEIAH